MAISPEELYLDLSLEVPRDADIDVHRETDGQLYDAMAARFFRRYPFADSVQAAYMAESASLFTVGLPEDDTEHLAEAPKFRWHVFEEFEERWGKVYNAEPSPRGVGAAIVHREHGAMVQVSIGEADERPTEMRRMAVQLRERAVRGLSTVHSTKNLLIRLQFLYRGESEPVWEEDMLALDLTDSDIETVYGSFRPETITFDDLSADMRHLYGADLSKETLDARFRIFVGLLQLELPSIILYQLNKYALASAQRTRRACQWAEEYRDVLLSDDFSRKHEVMYTLARTLRDDARTAKLTPLKEYLGALGKYGYEVAKGLDEFLQFFVNVYAHLRYELPPQLQVEQAAETTDPEPIRSPQVRVRQPAGTAVVAATVAPPPVTEKVPARPTREVQANLDTRRDVLAEQVQRRLAGWQQSKSQRDRQLFGPLASLLAADIEVPDESGVGTWQLGALEPDYAATLADMLVQLHRLSQQHDVAHAREAVEQALQTRQELAATLEKLIADGRRLGAVTALTVRIPDIASGLQRLANSWHLYRKVIAQAWPGCQERPDEDEPARQARIDRIREVQGSIWQLLPPPEPGSLYATLLEDYERRYKLEF